jgi:hypothetical protein
MPSTGSKLIDLIVLLILIVVFFILASRLIDVLDDEASNDGAFIDITTIEGAIAG